MTHHSLRPAFLALCLTIVTLIQSATPGAFAAIPSEPTNFLGSNFTGTTATLTWTDTSSDEDNFNIYYATTNSQPGSPAYTPVANAVSQPVTGLSTSLPNYFWLTAENTDGESSATKICLKYSSVAGKILSCDGVANDVFGYSVSIDGDYAVIGAQNEGSWGSAYVYRRSSTTWTELAKLEASDQATDAFFGNSVAISGDTVVVGANGRDDNGSDSGAAYVFTKPSGDWQNMTETQKLTPGDAAAGDFFGISVGVSGSRIVVGSPFSGTGAAYIFEYGVSWTETDKLVGSDSVSGDGLGLDVGISGNAVIASAFLDDSAKGSAYIFEYDGSWSQSAKLTASDGVGGDFLGYSAAISGNTAVVGAPGTASVPGKAYVYEKSGAWADATEDAILTASDAANNDSFGREVAADGTNVVVGAYKDNSDTGAAYLFVKPPSGWSNMTETNKYTASDAATGDFYGRYMAMSGDFILIGAYNDDDNGGDSGSVYAYDANVYFPPDQPSDFYASAFAGTSVTLNWTDNSDDETGFRIYHSNDTTQGAVDYSAAANSVSASLTNGDILALSPSSPNYFWLTANKGGVESAHLQICLRYYGISGKILACDATASDFFGTVAISGNTAVIGAPGDDDNGTSAGSAYVFEKNGSTWTQVAKLVASDGAADDNFGYAVAIDADTVVVGAYGDDTFATDSGAAYIFVKPTNGWSGTMSETARISSSDLSSIYNYFGRAVAIDGDTIVVGQPSTSGVGRGHVFVEPGGGWVSTNTPDAILNASLGNGPGYHVAQSVDISGDTIILGRDFTALAPVVYIYVEPGGGWTGSPTETVTLGSFAATTSDHFGTAVSIDGDVVVVGAYGDDDNGADSGSAFVYVKPGGGWVTTSSHSAKLTASDGLTGDQFGISVDISEDAVVIGAPCDNSCQGSAYIFIKPGSGWSGALTEDGKIENDNPATMDLFGGSVSIDGNNWITGSTLDDIIATDDGSAIYNDISTIFPPDDPSSLTIDDATDTTIDISWTDNSDDETGFNIYYDTVNIQPGSPNATNTAGDTTYTASGLTAGTTYYFWVTAENTNGESATITASAATDSVCGNGVPEVGETCDDGNTDSDDGCSATCQSESCGDGIMQFSEQCDDSNTDNGDGCSASCLTEYCGDGIVNNNGTETCDGGPDCTVLCTILTACTLPDLVTSEVKIPAPADVEMFYSVDSNVHINGNYAFVGGVNTISKIWQVDIYKFDGINWNHLKTLIDGVDTGFGSFTDTNDDGSLFIVGSIGGPFTGTAHIFGRDMGGVDNFGLIKSIVADDGQTGDLFGTSVQIDGSYAVVGAYGAPGLTFDGAAYIFEKDSDGAGGVLADNWGQIKKLTGVTTGYMGTGVDLENDRLAVGEAGKNGFAGEINIYEKDFGGVNNWGLVAETTADGAVAPDTIGITVSLEGDTLLAGQLDQALGNNYVYVFEKDEDGPNMWGNTTKFQADDAGLADEFGTWGLELIGDVAYVGAGYNDTNASNAGAAYIFYRHQGGADNWGQLQRIVPSDIADSDNFGIGLHTDGARVIMTSRGSGVGGASYIYDAATCPLPAPSSSGGSSSGGITSEPGSPANRTCDSPRILNLPTSLPVQNTDGSPSVLLEWDNSELDSATKIEVLRNGIQIASLGSAITSYEDKTVEANVCTPGTICRVKQYSYSLRTKNECGEKKKGSVGVADINPEVPVGVSIDVKADLAIIIKDGFSTLFENRLQELSMIAEQGAVQELITVDNKICSETRQAYFATERSRLDRTLATNYISICFGAHLSELEIAQIVEPMLISRLDAEALEALVAEKVTAIIESRARLSAVLTGSYIDRDNLLCGGKELDQCTTDDKSTIESFFKGSSQAASVLIEVFDIDGNSTIAPIQTKTNIFGQIHGLNLGAFLSGEPYKIKITLLDQHYVLPRIVDVTINNPIPSTVNDVTTYRAQLKLTLDEQFCFGDFDEDGDVDIDDILALKGIVQTGSGQLFDVWNDINLDGLAGFDLLDMLTLLKNFQCSVE